MIIVRRAGERDIAGILSCLRAAFEPYRHQYTEAAFADTVLLPESLRSRMTAMSVFVAEEEGPGIVGTIAAALDGDAGHLRGMAVLPAWHRQGVAPRLLRRALDELVASGRHRATLGTTAPLLRAMRFYEARGFERTGRVRDFFGMPLCEYAKALDADVAIREADAADLPSLLELVNAAYRPAEGHLIEGDRLSELELRDHFARGRFLIASRDGEPPAACVFVEPKADRRASLGLLAVDPSAQRRGLGRIMMAAAERLCLTAGCHAIDILIVNLRTELPPFYASMGFVPDGTTPFEDPRQLTPLHFIRMTLPLA
jgi:GNAT superfamily N-acetyltransferase